MDSHSLGDYYLQHRDEFVGTAGHQKLLEGLKHFIQPIQTSKRVLGIDVGTCVGKYIPNLQVLCKDATILCFEPNPVNIAKLEQDFSFHTNLRLFRHCISNEQTVTSFYNWKDKKKNLVGNGAAGLRSGGEKICDVEVKRLDDVLSSEFPNEDLCIQFIKIDTEGNDTNVIKSLGEYLVNTNYIIFECSDCLDDIRGPGIENPMKDIVDFLSLHGFDTYRIGTKKLLKVNDEWWNDVYEHLKFWSDCFAIKKGDPLIHRLINENFEYVY